MSRWSYVFAADLGIKINADRRILARRNILYLIIGELTVATVVGLILVIILIIFLLGGFSGRFGGYGYVTVTAASVSSASF